jgi:carbamoyl-phosphate synthase small subunit
MPEATLALEDGTILTGAAFGAQTDAVFELVFNTSMTGYQEILSDPSYRGQGVLFTTSHVGNVGINLEDDESGGPQAAAAVLRSLSPVVSNWRAEIPLAEWLARHGVPGISGVDTRALTRKLREQGTLKAALSTRGTPTADLLAAARAWPGLDGRDMVGEATCPQTYPWPGDLGSRWIINDPGAQLRHVVAFDFGAKRNILRHLAGLGARVTVVPAYTTCEAVMALRPDGILLSNGPGDPAGLPGIVDVVREIIDTGVPIFGICLGHQLIGRAVGGETVRLKFGHHAGNHPVQDLLTGKVQVTSQNHNYAVDAASLDPDVVEVTHRSLNDGTVEGLRLKRRPVFSVQYHPEAAPGPHDADALFRQFLKVIECQNAPTSIPS